MHAALMDMANRDGSVRFGGKHRPELERPVVRKGKIPAFASARRCAFAALAIGVHGAALLGFLIGAPASHPKEAPPMMMITLTEAEPAIREKTPHAVMRNFQPAAVKVAVPESFVMTTAPAPVASAAQNPPHPALAATPSSAKAEWADRVLQHLERVKRYPRDAVLQHAQGVVTLHFSIDRAGQVLRAAIEKSSGYDVLDEEALALIRRAAPLPKPPESLPGEIFDLAVPVSFSLNR